MFEAMDIDYNDREWVLEMLNYMYLLADEEIKFLNELSYVMKRQDLELKKDVCVESIKVLRVDGDRGLLSRFNKTSMTVDEYVDRIMKYSNEPIEVGKENDGKGEDDEEIVEEPETDNRKDLESKEDGVYGSGNRNGMG